MALMIQETFINETRGHIFSESDPYEVDYDHDELGKLYRSLSREYGRCTSKVYRDTENGIQAIGWVFESRQEYEDAHGWRGSRCENQADHKEQCTYLRHVWVTALELVEPTHPAQYRAVAVA